MVTKKLSYNPDDTTTCPVAKKEGAMTTETIDKVLNKVLHKLENYVDTVQPEKLNPQSLKHITATLKDIRDLQIESQPTQTQVTVIFDHPEWSS